MAEVINSALDSKYQAQLFEGAMEELEKIDEAWRVEAEITKAQYEAALLRIQTAQADADRLEKDSGERSKATHKVRDELAKTALKLVVKSPDIDPDRGQLIKLGVQLATGQRIGEGENNALIRDLTELDRAISSGDPIICFTSKTLAFALKPNQKAQHIELRPVENNNSRGVDFNIPYETLVYAEPYRSIYENRGMSVEYDSTYRINPYFVSLKHKGYATKSHRAANYYERTEFIRYFYSGELLEEKNVFIIGQRGIESVLDYYIKQADKKPDLEESAFAIWRGASLVTNGLGNYDRVFAGRSLNAIANHLNRMLDYNEALTLPAPLKPALQLINRNNMYDQLLDLTSTSAKNKRGLLANPVVLRTIMIEFFNENLSSQ